MPFVDSAELAGTGTGEGAALVGFVAAGAGAVARTALVKMRDVINVRDFGALGNGQNLDGSINASADDSAAIRAADAACGERATLYFPVGVYVVKQDGTNPWCIRKKSSNRWVGDAMGGSIIHPHSTVPVTCDIVLEVPSASYLSRGGGCSDINIANAANGSRTGRHAWHVNTTDALSTPDLQINGNIYERLSTGSPTSDSQGYGFCHTNSASNTEGGMYDSHVRESVLGGGFKFTKTGDSNTLRDIRTSGFLPNVLDQIVNAEGSANTFTIDGWNCTNGGGLLQVTNAPGLIIRGINGEDFAGGAATYNGSAAVWLKAPPAWANATAYAIGDLVSQSNIIYRSRVAHTSATATDQPGTGSSWGTKWADYDPFENVSFGPGLVSVSTGFDGNALFRIDSGNRISVNKVRALTGIPGITPFIVYAAVTNADLRWNTYTPGLAVSARLSNSGTETIFDSYDTATQATSKSTGVTLNTATGTITMNNASLAANTAVGFQLINNLIGANDTVAVMIKGGATADAYQVSVDMVSAGSCRISLRNVTGGALAEAVALNFRGEKAGI